MSRKYFLLLILSAFTFLASGCTIAKCTGGAVAGAGQGAAAGASEGLKDDAGFVKKTDTWIKDNLW
ncbi:MAG: hypothetical protein WCY09_01905 [Candidatus Omnitrophota bacterium]